MSKNNMKNFLKKTSKINCDVWTEVYLLHGCYVLMDIVNNQ